MSGKKKMEPIKLISVSILTARRFARFLPALRSQMLEKEIQCSGSVVVYLMCVLVRV